MTRDEKRQAIEAWEANQPANDSQWDADVQEESLHVKRPRELQRMRARCRAKRDRLADDLVVFNRWPDAIKRDLFESLGASGKLTGQTLLDEVEVQFQRQRANIRWKAATLRQSVVRIQKEQDLRARGVVTRTPR